MSSTSNSNHDEAISQFCAVTGADEERAKGLLEACNWDLELAINMQVDTDDGRRRGPTTSSSSTTSAAGPSTSSAPVVSRKDRDDDVLVDLVRPPIPPVRQVLVNDPVPRYTQRRYPTRGSGSSHTDVYDAFRDFQAEAQWQELAQQEHGELSTNGGAESSSSSSSATAIATNASKRTLQDLFRPPLELMFRGSLESARETASEKNKWLLVNIQNSKEFACQALNRDVWSNQAVKEILKEAFIFWQVYYDSFEGTRFVQFYSVKSQPHVSIIDPRTGEQMKSWPKTIDHNSFCDSVVEFLSEHPSPNGTSDVTTMKKLRVKEETDNNVVAASTLYDQSEEAQLEAAIRASLLETENSNSSSKVYLDEDSYTDAIDSDNDNSQLAPQQQHQPQQQQQQPPQLTKQPATPKQPVVVIEDYKKYLGSDTEKFSDLVVRFPDGTRDQFKFPSDSLMKALFLLLTSRGFGMNQYYYVTNFPRRPLHELPDTDTLHDAKLIRETIFVERRPSDD